MPCFPCGRKKTRGNGERDVDHYDEKAAGYGNSAEPATDNPPTDGKDNSAVQKQEDMQNRDTHEEITTPDGHHRTVDTHVRSGYSETTTTDEYNIGGTHVTKTRTVITHSSRTPMTVYANEGHHDGEHEEEHGDRPSGHRRRATHKHHSHGCNIKDALDGFDEDTMDHLLGKIKSKANGGRAFTNLFSIGGFRGKMARHLRDGKHRFQKIKEDTGEIDGADHNANRHFGMGGKHNKLGGVGKVILDNITSGTFKRDVKPFVPPVPAKTETGEEVQPASLVFHDERDRCLKAKTLFEDPEFPASDKSLYYRTPPRDRVVWKRPGEIVENPQLIAGQDTRFDVDQGALGDCWLLAAVANLTLRDELFHRVVPPDQSFTENYAGIFHFQFWRYGKWVDVVIDDRLPTVDGQLYYMHSTNTNVFWSALLEKAYAKLYSSYENLDGGTAVEALEDFTGGLTEYIDLRKADKESVMAMMISGFQMGSLFSCSIDADPSIREAQMSCGLIRGHAYSITALHAIRTSRGDTTLVRARNPWGNSKEWKGAWSDEAPEWNELSQDQKAQMNVEFKQDGEFWMSFDDFLTYFEQLEICNISAEIEDEINEMTGVDVNENEKEAKWTSDAVDGEWSTEKNTAGGCANNRSSYPLNPQYHTVFNVPPENTEKDGKVSVIVAVLQKYRREMRTVGKDSLPVGFAVYSLAKANSSGPLNSEFFMYNAPVAKTEVFINVREVTCRFRVLPGDYVVIPCTFDPYTDGEFLLRIFSNSTITTSELKAA